MKTISTLRQTWIQMMREILNPDISSKVEDYMEIKNYQISFSFNQVYELKSDARIYKDYLEMHKVFFSREENCFGHSYADAILVPTQKETSPIEAISAILQENQTTRKAVMTFIPYDEMRIPCISHIQFLVRDGILDIIYSARGQDIYRKFPCDAMCIAEFGEKIAVQNHYTLGNITANIASAHIYLHNFTDAEKCIAEADRNVILTGNMNKYKDYMELLANHQIEVSICKLEIPEIQSTDWKTIIKAKAKYAYEHLGFPVWIDDVWLELEAYPLFPGSYTKCVWKQLGVEGLKALLVGKSNHGTIVCRMCRYTGAGYEYVFGENHGRLLLDAPIENEKMPLNSVFVGEEQMCHRSRAIEKLIRKDIEKI